MQEASNTFKKSFLRLMIKGLRLNGIHSKMMGFQERKRAIKLSADAAMALARGRTTTKWSAALISDLSTTNNQEGIMKKCNGWKIPTSKKILRRSLRSRSSRRGKSAAASVVARRMVRKRTQVLKRIIPGGESLDGLSLLGETLDYVIHLKAQVDLMQCLAKALGASNLKSQGDVHCKKEEEEVINSSDSGPKKSFKSESVMDIEPM